MKTLVVAAMSARTLAEAAARDGHTVMALDLFGDIDTRAACAQWAALGEPGSLRMDASRLLSALGELAQRGEVVGWVSGAGFEGRPDLLEQGAQVLRLIGNDAAVVRRVRNPQAFFGVLDRLGVPHPEVRAAPPSDDDVSGWLLKDFQGTGGWHIRRWRGSPLPTARPPSMYFQREASGTPMSTTFIANGTRACLLGFNQLKTQPFGAKPHVFCGAVGPVDLPASATQQITRSLHELVAAFGLHGLGSLDFLLDGETISVLEINPRPPASMALYEDCRFVGEPARPGHGLMEAHVRACLHRELPVMLANHNEASVRGIEIVYAHRPLNFDTALSNHLLQWPGAHDLPAAGTRLTRGDPLCSIVVTDTTAGAVNARLIEGRKALLNSLER